jgi:hypothetical protein
MSDNSRNKKSLKINNQASSVMKPAPKVSDDVHKKATAALARNDEYKTRLMDLSIKLKAMMEDKTLTENKSSISKDIEKDTANKIVALAADIDLDEDQPYSEGSRGMCFLLLKFMIMQRDTLNALAFKLEKLEKYLTVKDIQTK